jgi:hypothetical protein
MSKTLIQKLKPGVPKTVLIAIGASIWGFAAFRILKMGFLYIEGHAINHFVNYLIGIAGFIPFFLLVFRKVSLRYVNESLICLPGALACLPFSTCADTL